MRAGGKTGHGVRLHRLPVLAACRPSYNTIVFTCAGRMTCAHPRPVDNDNGWRDGPASMRLFTAQHILWHRTTNTDSRVASCMFVTHANQGRGGWQRVAGLAGQRAVVHRAADPGQGRALVVVHEPRHGQQAHGVAPIRQHDQVRH